ncbi:hypothetical protein HY333_00895 [Candidatus Collierbacteria bacterium]|nr:hypothetical protein [Candidatus Collierbacteria bacterium]
MIERYLKNNTGSRSEMVRVVLVLGLTIASETIFKSALYWPLLFLLLDWKYVYWLGFTLGLLLSVIWGEKLGLASLLLVVALFGLKKGGNLLMISPVLGSAVLVIAAAVVDRLAGGSWSWAEGLTIFFLSLWLINRNNQHQSVSLRRW